MKLDSIENVIEAHRIKVGADRLHVSIAKGCTPEQLDRELTNLENQFEKYNSFTPLEQERAKVARLRARLKTIAKMCQKDVREPETEEMRNFRLAIFAIADVWAEASLPEDTKFMEDARK